MRSVKWRKTEAKSCSRPEKDSLSRWSQWVWKSVDAHALSMPRATSTSRVKDSERVLVAVAIWAFEVSNPRGFGFAGGGGGGSSRFDLSLLEQADAFGHVPIMMGFFFGFSLASNFLSVAQRGLDGDGAGGGSKFGFDGIEQISAGLVLTVNDRHGQCFRAAIGASFFDQARRNVEPHGGGGHEKGPCNLWGKRFWEVGVDGFAPMDQGADVEGVGIFMRDHERARILGKILEGILLLFGCDIGGRGEFKKFGAELSRVVERGARKKPIAGILPWWGKFGGVGELAVDVDSSIAVESVLENTKKARLAGRDFAHAIIIDVARPKAARELLFKKVLAKPVQAMGAVAALKMFGPVAPQVDFWGSVAFALDREAKKEAVFALGCFVFGTIGFEVGLIESAKSGQDRLFG